MSGAAQKLQTLTLSPDTYGRVARLTPSVGILPPRHRALHFNVGRNRNTLPWPLFQTLLVSVGSTSTAEIRLLSLSPENWHFATTRKHCSWERREKCVSVPCLPFKNWIVALWFADFSQWPPEVLQQKIPWAQKVFFPFSQNTKKGL